MEENAGNVFFCNQIIYENTYEKKHKTLSGNRGRI